MTWKAKDDANEALKRAKERYRLELQRTASDGSQEQYKAFQAAKRALVRARSEAFKFWMPGDPPLD